MGLTKALKNKMAEQQGYRPVTTDETSPSVPAPVDPSVARRKAIIKNHAFGLYMTAFLIFLIGLLFWSSCANIVTSALIKVTPSPSGNPRAVPLLNFGICGLGIVTALVAVAWLCKRGSYVVFLMFLTFSCLTSMYLITSAVVLGYTFTGQLKDCPHQYTTYAYHSYHQGWTFTCDKFSFSMYVLAMSSLTFDAIGLFAVTLLLVLGLRYQLPLILDLLDERDSTVASRRPALTVNDVEAAVEI